MKSLFFLKNNSHVNNIENLYKTNPEFVEHVKEIVKSHGFAASVYTAVWCEAKKGAERYGAAVEIEYETVVDLVAVANVFKNATLQGHILINSKGENYPQEFQASKIACCDVSLTESENLYGAAMRMHNAQVALLKMQGLNTAVVLYEKPDGIGLQAVANPQEDANYDFWQKKTGDLLRSLGLQPCFSLTAALYL